MNSTRTKRGKQTTSHKGREDCLIQLSNRKDKSKREKALSVIVQALTMEFNPPFIQNNVITVVHECLFCIKKGSAKEFQLSAQAIGLLSLTLEDEDSAHEIYQDSLPVLSNALESKSILNCLAIVTFFGATNLAETETSMKMLWQFLNSDIISRSPIVLSAAISAWSFLLTTIDKWSLKHKHWQTAISFFSNLLEEDNESVYASAGEALALIFEIDCCENFSTEKGSLELEDCIIERLKGQVVKASEEREKLEAAMEVVKFFESGKSLETYAKIGEHDELKLCTWCEKLQLKFVRDFLGEDGFVKQMRQSEKLQAVFDFNPTEKIPRSEELYIPDREEIKVKVFRGAGVKEDGSEFPIKGAEKQRLKKMTKSPNSFLNKARTRLLNKKRMQSEKSCFSHNEIDD